MHAVDGNNQDSEDLDVDYDQYSVEAVETITVRKSDYTPTLVLPMNMACLKKTKHHTIQLKYQI